MIPAFGLHIPTRKESPMKKTYETPTVDVVKFEYKDQVVAASGSSCGIEYRLEGSTSATGCTQQTPIKHTN